MDALELQCKWPGTPRTSAGTHDTQEDLQRRYARNTLTSGVLWRVADDQLVETAVLQCEGFEPLADGQCIYQVSFSDGQNTMGAMNSGNLVSNDIEG